MTELRTIRALSLVGLTPGQAETGLPECVLVDPATLLVDDTYQRNLSERSIKLIRKIVTEWDWRRFKPPVCARTEQGLEIIDGQHTASAAATHPDIAVIPVMVVEAVNREARAKAFIGQNRDRLGMTVMQMHFAAVIGGDEDAQTIDQVCSRAGLTILKTTPGNGIWQPRQTVAVAAIASLINRRNAKRAREVLQVLAEADLAPVNAGQIKAVDVLMHDAEYCNDVEPADITTALIALGGEAEQQAKVFAATHNVPQWRALAIVLFKKAKRRARRAS